MLNHTKNIEKIYEDIQRMLYYMIPEKWDKLYLYASVLDEPDEEGKKGELFLYYIQKGIFKKRPINVYEIPARFNLDESQYLKLVELLYDKISDLKAEFVLENPLEEMWTNLTISVHDLKFHVDYDYSNLNRSEFTSYERHIIWRYEYLGIGPEQVGKEEKKILEKYLLGPKTISRKEHYDSGIYIQDIENTVDFENSNDPSWQ